MTSRSTFVGRANSRRRPFPSGRGWLISAGMRREEEGRGDGEREVEGMSEEGRKEVGPI